MKRLKLNDFKLKNLKKEVNETTTNQLLGQVLGDCHDSGCDWCGPGTLSCDERSGPADSGDSILQ